MAFDTLGSLIAASEPAAAFRWTADHVRAINGDGHCAPPIGSGDVVRVSPDMDFWDAWPLQDEGGHPAPLPDGSTLWMALAAPHFPDPDQRHDHARIHLLRMAEGRWTHLGPAMPDGFSPGSREWSGSAVLAADGGVVLYFTATGRRGEAVPGFEQRLFRAAARLGEHGGSPALVDWRDLAEIVARDPAHYMASTDGGGAVGTIKAFRDPAYFRDPADGRHYILFTGSAAGSSSAFNGVIGAAVADTADAPWRIVPPLISADGLNNELERPHMLHRDGRYYLFWSTQRHVFDPAGPTGPTGLYGMVSDSSAGGWRPLNGSGLVIANPPTAPRQAYSWLVLPDLSVTSFIDNWGDAAASGPAQRFGATFAPFLHLALDGERATLVR